MISAAVVLPKNNLSRTAVSLAFTRQAFTFYGVLPVNQSFIFYFSSSCSNSKVIFFRRKLFNLDYFNYLTSYPTSIGTVSRLKYSVVKTMDSSHLLPVEENPTDFYTQPIALKSSAGRFRLAALLDSNKTDDFIGQRVVVCGWSRSVRKQGGGTLCFVTLTDGSTSSNLQVVVESGIPKFEELLRCGTGCSFRITGMIVKSPARGQKIEMLVKDPEQGDKLEILGIVDAAKYPLAKKEHTREHLREIAHLRPRTNLIGAVMRVRSHLAMATHRFFQDRGFLYIHTPIITASDCEGAGEMFSVSTILPEDPADKVPVTAAGAVDYTKDFFSSHAYLTVSGQLAVEPYCCALSDVYTFGPTFRAEKSHTSRHLSEFWMVEPELAFATLEDDMDCAESYIKFCVKSCMENCRKDLEWFEKNQEQGLIARLENILAEPFGRVQYTEAIEMLKRESKNASFDVPVEWGMDMGSEHERYLSEVIFKKPVIVFDYPKSFKAFYMKRNDDGKTVRAMDVLVPKIGELVGGSQREDQLDRLDAMIEEKALDVKAYWWYRELREYGSVPHSGFGLGFERLIMLVTGIENIRDTIPYPRYPGHAEF